MQTKGLWKCLISCGLLALAVPTLPVAPAPAAAGSVESGATEFAVWCSRCHGQDGKGGGSLAVDLETAAPDLTRLSKRNNGTFPAEMARETIDGRDILQAHRSDEMPAWGNWFEYDITAGGLQKQNETKTEAEIAERISRIVGYLESIQE